MPKPTTIAIAFDTLPLEEIKNIHKYLKDPSMEEHLQDVMGNSFGLDMAEIAQDEPSRKILMPESESLRSFAKMNKKIVVAIDLSKVPQNLQASYKQYATRMMKVLLAGSPENSMEIVAGSNPIQTIQNKQSGSVTFISHNTADIKKARDAGFSTLQRENNKLPLFKGNRSNPKLNGTVKSPPSSLWKHIRQALGGKEKKALRQESVAKRTVPTPKTVRPEDIYMAELKQKIEKRPKKEGPSHARMPSAMS